MRKSDPRWNDNSITPSCGNVFLDLGFSPAEAAVMTVQEDLAIQLERLMRSRRWTSKRAAAVFGISPARVIELKRGKYENFSVEMLLGFAARAGLRPELKLVA